MEPLGGTLCDSKLSLANNIYLSRNCNKSDDCNKYDKEYSKLLSMKITAEDKDLLKDHGGTIEFWLHRWQENLILAFNALRVHQ